MTKVRRWKKTDEFLVYDDAGESYHIVEATELVATEDESGSSGGTEKSRIFRCNQNGVSEAVKRVDEITFSVSVSKNDEFVEVLARRKVQ